MRRYKNLSLRLYHKVRCRGRVMSISKRIPWLRYEKDKRGVFRAFVGERARYCGDSSIARVADVVMGRKITDDLKRIKRVEKLVEFLLSRLWGA